MNRDGCHDTCTNGWIRHRGQWIRCPNHVQRRWDIGPKPPPIKTARAREIIAEAKATARAAAAAGKSPEPEPDQPYDSLFRRLITSKEQS